MFNLKMYTKMYGIIKLFIFQYFLVVGKTELAKQVARYLHKDNKKVNKF